MKEITVLSIAMAIFSLVSFGQTEKGKFVVSGSSALTYQNNLESGDANTSSFSVKPSVGYFVIDNLAVTFEVSVDVQKQSTYDPDVTTALAPGLAYYFPTSGIVRPFVNGSVGFASYKYTSTYDGNRYTLNGLAYGGGAGAAIFLKDNVSLDLGLNYVRLNLSAPNTGGYKENHNSLGLGLGFSIFF